MAIKHRLKLGKRTRVLVDASLTKKSVTDEMLASGATGWLLLNAGQIETESVDIASDAEIVEGFDSSDYLLHWTRRRVGPWPEQTNDEFLDDLIFRSARKDHREVAALRRILATERILASNALTRDVRPVVCFSDVTFEELEKLRVFRPHLSRWDFEPFGIAISKDWLVKRGAQAVYYGDDSVLEALPDGQRPFFQRNEGKGNVDWSIEREWRVVGDVDLRMVPVDAAVVFVQSKQDAREVASYSRWPIVVVGE